jgi:NitT/TauT family transport system substrate-binding protein
MNAAALYIALGKGYFTDEGITVDLKRVNSSVEAAAFLAQGQVDLGSVGLAAGTFNGFNRGFDMRIVATAASWGKEHSVAVIGNAERYRSGEIKDMRDLKGKRVSAPGGASAGSGYILHKALQTVGLTIKDVSVVNLAGSDMPVAIKNKAIDAGLASIPYTTLAVSEGWGVPLISNFEPGLAATEFVYAGAFIRDRPETGVKIMKALMRGARDLSEGKVFAPENLAIFAKYLGVSETVITQGKPLVYDPDMGIRRHTIEDSERYFREYGFSEYAQALDTDKIIDTSFQKKALAELGPAKTQ